MVVSSWSSSPHITDSVFHIISIDTPCSSGIIEINYEEPDVICFNGLVFTHKEKDME